MIKKVISWLKANKLATFYSSTIVLALGFIYLINIKNLVTTNNRFETRDYLGISTYDNFLSNIAFAPIKSLYLLVDLISSDPVYKRLLTVVVVLLTLLIFYKLICKWHTERIALVTTVLFALSTYSLALARFTNTDVLFYLLFPGLILMATWLKSKSQVKRLVYVLPLITIMLYLPGAFFIIAFLTVIFKRRLLLAWKHVNLRWRIYSLSASALIIAPLIFSLITRPAQIFSYLGFDLVTDTNYRQILDNLMQIPSSIFYNGIEQPERWLFGTPILDVASIVLFILGIYAYYKGQNTLRARLLLVLFGLSFILLSTGTLVSPALIIPLFYIVIANGITFLLQTWFTVFPENPAARNLSVVLIVLMAGLVASYHLQRYFVAWPNSTATKAIERTSN